MSSSKSNSVCNGEEAEVNLRAQEFIWNQAFSYLKSMCLKCAVELGISEAIGRHEKVTIPELASRLSVPEPKHGALRSLMRLLTREGLFLSSTALSGEESFELTEASHLLPSFSPLILLFVNPILFDSHRQLSRWLQGPASNTPATSFEMAHGKTIWEFAAGCPQFNATMNEAMASDSCLTAFALTGADALCGITTIVDVGGGNGSNAAALVRIFPNLSTYIVLDMPHVIAAAIKLEPADLPRIQFVAGDMFHHIPRADAVLLKWILHDWNDEECVKILQRCKEAIPSKEEGGKVIIIDMVMGVCVSSQTSAETQLLLDLNMRTHSSGRERDESEWRKLFAAAGFSDYKITPSLGLRSIIEVFP